MVVEDAPEFRQLLRNVFDTEGYGVLEARDGETALATIEREDPDVIVLDVMLPGMDGIEVCRQLRTFSDAYVIMLTARDDEVDKLVGLAVGADDYMTKPFSPKELVARVHVMMRRPRRTAETKPAPHRRTAGDLEIDVLSREVTVGGGEVNLTKIEFDLLAALTERPQMVFSRQLLLDRIWGPHWVGDDHVVDVHIANLRKKIDLEGRRHIKTVRGVGYRLA
ncbi:MAG: response regulator transcription factor [Actinomycetota bacterium]